MLLNYSQLTFSVIIRHMKNTKKHFFWIVELFVWLLILFLVSSGIMFFIYNQRKDLNTYQIFLPDVDGLINGSPVRILGIQVGYVNQIDIVGDDVYVKFIVTEPNAKVPRGSRATVEFSGLGGSKSLEIYPPDSKEALSGKLIVPQSPKRIHDCLGLLNDMYDKIIDITYEVSHFMNQIGLIKTKAKQNGEWHSESADEFLKFTNQRLDKMQIQRDKFSNKIKKITEGKKNGKCNAEN